MDDTGPHAYHSGPDPARELAELEAAQQELWSTLREEDDPELRMSLLSQFSENRAEIGRLRAELGAEVQSTGRTAPFYQVELVGEDEHPVEAEIDGVVINRRRVGRRLGLSLS